MAILKRLKEGWQELVETVRLAAVIIRSPEEYLADADQLQTEVISRGDPRHRHRFTEVKWDEQLGPSTLRDAMGQSICRMLESCPCGAQRIKSYCSSIILPQPEA